MIRHIVLIKFTRHASEPDIAEIFGGLAALTQRLPGACGFAGGRSQSPEQIERGYMHGFTVDFHSWEDLKTYAVHPEHKALGARIVANAEGGIDGVLVLDLNVPN